MIRPAAPADTPALVALTAATGVFYPHEVEALQEVLDDFHAGVYGPDHRAAVWADGPAAAPAGYVYFAPASMTDRTWELWWVAVDPARQGHGIGRELVAYAEAECRAADARLLLIETSSIPRYAPTRGFYGKLGYAEAAVIPDFYADGDSKVVYSKRITSAGVGASVGQAEAD